jgi:DNA-binding transcriptional MerR regulator
MTDSVTPPPAASTGLSIGEAARIAGVTTRAVRHYHAVGLLAEPARDSSGYRRYTAADLIALVRITRLRALGVPVARIAERIGRDDDAPLAPWIGELADDLDAEITRLTAMRDTVRRLAETRGLESPGEQLAQALRASGHLGEEDHLPTQERDAAALVDILHPRGIAGAIDNTRDLLTNPVMRERFSVLIERFRGLTDDTTAAERDQLAADFVALLPRPDGAARPVEIDVVERLVGARISHAQRDVLRRMRARWTG